MPAKSKKQQQFMGMVHAYQQGTLPASQVSPAVRDAAMSMSKKQSKEFAETKHKDLLTCVKRAKKDISKKATIEKAAFRIPKFIKYPTETMAKGTKAVTYSTARKAKTLDLAKGFVPGAIASTVATGLLYPVDTFQMRKQVGLPAPKDAKDYFKGIGPKMTKAVPMGAIMFGLHSIAKKMMKIT